MLHNCLKLKMQECIPVAVVAVCWQKVSAWGLLVGGVYPGGICLRVVPAQGGLPVGICLGEGMSARGYLPGRCLPRGVSACGLCIPACTGEYTSLHPVNRMTDRCKTLPCRNYVADGNNIKFVMLATILIYLDLFNE